MNGAGFDDWLAAHWERFTNWVRTTTVPILEPVHGPLDRWLAGLPAWSGPLCATLLFVSAAVGVLMLKREYIFRGAPDKSRWRDLRLWALFALAPYVLVYLIY